MKSFTIIVGLLHFSKVRDYLNQCKFIGRNIDWIESSGWIDRTFTIRGTSPDIDIVLKEFQHWVFTTSEPKQLE